MDDGVAIGASLVSQATATEVGAAGFNRQLWANTPFIRRRQNTLRLAAGMNGEVNRAEAR